MPSMLKSRITTYYSIGVVAIFLGIVIWIAFHRILEPACIILPAFAGVYFIAKGYMLQSKLEKFGWSEFRGVCINHIRTPLLPTAFLVDCGEEIISVGATSTNALPPVNCHVCLYVDKHSNSYTDTNGYSHYHNIIGYEIIPTLEKKED